MQKMNYHTHSSLCDGTGELRDYVEAAVKKGFRALGFSGHSPLPFPNDWTMDDEALSLYLNGVRELKRMYGEDIEIYLGLETDYLDTEHNPAQEIYHSLGLDYQIGSVHAIPDPKDGLFYSFDGPLDELNHLIHRTFDGSGKNLITGYYHQVRKMVEAGGFDILGHFDSIKKHNREVKFFSEEEDWYKEIVFDTLSAVAESGVILEVNTGGMSRNYTREPYPSKWIIRRCAELEIPIMLNSDAHRPDLLDYGFPETEKMLVSLGVSRGRILLDGSWKEISYG